MGVANERDSTVDVPAEDIGESLKRMRELREFSIEEVAHRLRLQSTMIDLMESKSFPGGLHEIFAKGYLKSYARLLQFSETDINAMVASLSYKPDVREESIFSRQSTAYPTYYIRHLLTGSVVLIMIALFILWFEPGFYQILIQWLS